METTVKPEARSCPVASQSATADALLRQGDLRWARRTPQWREHALAMPWPQELLGRFSLRMAGHGMSISRALMLSDRPYALQQLVHAHSLGDETLSLMATQLFHHFESHQSGVAAMH